MPCTLLPVPAEKSRREGSGLLPTGFSLIKMRVLASKSWWAAGGLEQGVCSDLLVRTS